MNIGIIGGGPSGMMAALVAVKSGHKVTILEHTNRIGKKLLSTGSGKCNLTNDDMNICHFHGGNEVLINHVITAFTKDDALSFFSDIGLYTRNKNGYYYPFNEQASSVLDIFRASLRNENIEIITDCKIISILASNKKNGGFIVKSVINSDNNKDNINYNFDKLIIAAGSKAAPKTGSDGSGYELCKKLGHHIIDPLPALCGLKCEGGYFKSIKGIRCKAKVSLIINNQTVGSENGELQINDYGFSGIPVMQLSYLAAKAIKNHLDATLNISFMPEYNASKLYDYLKMRIQNNPNYQASELLLSILHKNLSALMLKKSGINAELICSRIADKQLKQLCNNICSFSVKIIGTNSYNDSQVCSGGVDLNEVDYNLQSKLIKGLYFAGEILDVNGDCGGYNLQWAWSSGYIAGSLLTNA